MSQRLLFLASIMAFLLPFDAHGMANPVTITLMPQTTPAYVEIQLDSASSTVPVDLSFALQGSDSAVSITSADDPNFPTTCTTSLNPNTSCNIWLHSVNNQSVGVVNEGQLNIQVSDQGIVVQTASFNLRNESDLYMGGGFTQATNSDGSTVNTNYVVKWDGNIWSALGSGLNGTVYALTAAIDGLIYVGGYFTQAGDSPINNIVQWNPATQQWTALGTGLSDNVQALTVGSDDSLYAGGYFTQAGSNPANFIARWDTKLKQWSALGNGLSAGVQAVTADNKGHLYVGGKFINADGKPVNLIAKWDTAGGQWSALGSGLNNENPYNVRAITIGTDGSIYVAGLFTQAGGLSVQGIAKWDPIAQQWSTLEGGLDNSPFALSTGVGGLIYVAGPFTQAGSNPANHIAKWDPKEQKWSALGGGVGAVSPVFDAATALTAGNDGLIYVGGYFTEAGGNPANHIAVWNLATQQWSTLGNGVNNVVNAFLLSPVLHVVQAR